MSVNMQAYNQYKRSAVETVAPEKLLLMLYDAALKNINNAKKAIEDKDVNRAHGQIMKTEEIIVELMSTLNMEYEISERLFSLYEYFYHRLTLANAQKDIGILDEVGGFLLELRDTWQEAVNALKTAAPQEGKKPESGIGSGLKTVVTDEALGGKPMNRTAANASKGINITG